VTVRAANANAAASSPPPTTPKTAAFLCVLALSGAALIPPLQEIGGAAERAYKAAGAPLRLLPPGPSRRRTTAPPPRVAEAVAQVLLALLSVGPFVALAFVSGSAGAGAAAAAAPSTPLALALTAAAALLLPAYLRLALLLGGCRPSGAAGQAVMLSASALRLVTLVQVAAAALAAAPAARGAWAAARAAVEAAVDGSGGNWKELLPALLGPLHPSVALQAVLLPLAVGVWALASFARPASGWWQGRRSGDGDEEALAPATT
jgi:hypothetical protein